MRDQKDRQTSEMFMTPGARRQASYAQKQRDLGRKQVAMWVTAAEAAALREYLEKLRKKA